MKKILLGVGVVALFMGLFFFLTREKMVVIDVSTLPIITAEGGVTLRKETINRPVMSPETVEAPFTLVTEMGARAIVTFPDGSELRASENSELSVETATYTKGNGELKVGAKLSIGRVWSNIVALVTPESKWEVETSNVVATVRGTAFGVEATAGTTTILGSEHTVELTLIDPETGERDENRKRLLGEDEFVTIGDDVSKDSTKEFPTPEKRSSRDDDDSWIKENEGRDGNNDNGNDDSLESSDADGDSPDSSADDDTVEIEDAREDIEGALEDEDDAGEEAVVPAVLPARASASPSVRPTALSITPSVPLGGIIEGTSVPITATVVYSDGTKREASNAVTWSVIGNVGSMRGYIFDPLLDPSVSEFGRAYGSIRAVWKDPETGASLDASTEIFEVKPKIVRGIEEG